MRNYSKANFNSTSTMPTLQHFVAGYSPAFSPAPPGVGSVVSPFRRVHKNMFLANYNSLASVLLDDGGSRMLMYNNYMAFGAWGVGESCHESQWVYGVGNLYAYSSAGGSGGGGPVIIHNEGPSPLGIRTFFYNDTFLLVSDSTWCDVYGSLNLVRSFARIAQILNGVGSKSFAVFVINRYRRNFGTTWCIHLQVEQQGSDATAVGTHSRSQ